jgi:replicative DNA helicase
MGKSALALCMAANVAVRNEKPVALFTLEMSKSEVTQRLMCAEGKVESQRLRTGKLATDDWPRLTAACSKLTKAPIYVDDTGSITMMEIRSKLRRLKMREQDLALVIVDYLQLMTSGTTVENRVQEVSQISRSLKVLARDLDVPIVALSQLSRAVEQRHDKRPILSDLRESGCLTGETRVYLPDEGVYQPISSLAGRAGFRVLAVDPETWRLGPRTVTNAFATGTRPVYRLTTNLGHQVRATGNHKFLAYDGWRRLDDLAPGMRVAVPQALRGPYRRSMTHRELALLGHLVGGRPTVRGHGLEYTSEERGLADLVARLARHVFGDRVAPEPRRHDDLFATLLASTRPRDAVTAWLAELGLHGDAAGPMRVPERVFRQATDGIAVFLRHLWATDGRMDVGAHGLPPTLRFDARSEQLAVDVQSLLLRLGITSSRRVVDGRHRLTVSSWRGVQRFLATIGAAGTRRTAACAAIEERLRTIAAPPPAYGGGGAQTLLAPSAVEIDDASPTTGDVYWDEIVSIERDGEDEVYDLTVDGLHNFVAEDVIVHNSIEQDADLVLFVYRDEYYNPEDTESAGIAELILAKHRNGPTGLEKLAFQKRYAKFSDLAAA